MKTNARASRRLRECFTASASISRARSRLCVAASKMNRQRAKFSRRRRRLSMRIAVINWSRRHVGGAETYISQIITELARLGHELAFMHEIDSPVNREQIVLPEGVPAWCVSELGARRAMDALREWAPDLI